MTGITPPHRQHTTEVTGYGIGKGAPRSQARSDEFPLENRSETPTIDTGGMCYIHPPNLKRHTTVGPFEQIKQAQTRANKHR